MGQLLLSLLLRFHALCVTAACPHDAAWGMTECVTMWVTFYYFWVIYISDSKPEPRCKTMSEWGLEDIAQWNFNSGANQAADMFLIDTVSQQEEKQPCWCIRIGFHVALP